MAMATIKHESFFIEVESETQNSKQIMKTLKAEFAPLQAFNKKIQYRDKGNDRQVIMHIESAFTVKDEEDLISTLGFMGYNFAIHKIRYFKTDFPQTIRQPGQYTCPNCKQPVSDREDHIEFLSDWGPDTYECRKPSFLDRL